jgi:hypothetical protein
MIESAKGVERLIVRLSDAMVDLDKPIALVFGGRELFKGSAPRRIATLSKTLGERGDPAAIFGAEIEVQIQGEK